jgi:acyl carrier protein
MSRPSADAARTAILAACAQALRDAGFDPEAVGDDTDLRAAGVIDSLGFVELIVEVEAALGVELDLDAVEPSRMTVIGELVALASSQAAGDLQAAS